MAHFAELNENNVVNRVIVVNNSDIMVNGVESEAKGKEFCNKLFGGEWVQTSYNNNFRKQYAGKGYTYDEEKDVFISPQPYPSWELDENNDWQAPIPRPEDEKDYTWNEEIQEWEEVLL